MTDSPEPVTPPHPGEVYTGPPRNNYEDHQPEMHLVPSYGTIRTGHGRWAALVDLSGPIGTIWTDDGLNLGIVPEPGQPMGHLIEAIQGGFAAGAPATEVFNAYAAWASQSHWAEPVQEGDLGTLT